MRFKSKKIGGYTIYAITGTNTVSFAIDFTESKVKGLLGFAVEREDHIEHEKYFIKGFKVFVKVIPQPTSDLDVSTFEHPIQSFVWDDFTAKPGYEYTYTFHPLKGTSKNLDRTTKPISIKVKTEVLIDEKATHHVFFNRGVMSSPAYKKKFNNQAPDKIQPLAKQQEAYNWLARDLLKGLKGFVAQAKPNHKLYACFYEFHYEEVVALFKNTHDRGVDVKIIIDAKVKKDKDGKDISFPRTKNLETIGKVGLPLNNIIQREASPSYIQHNKFVIWADENDKPQAVWTGSTNISEGGIFGHTNVGHWVIDSQVAAKYKQYWDLLSIDPEGKEFKKQVESIEASVTADEVLNMPHGTKPIFSPRANLTMLNTYADLVDKTSVVSCITLAFGVQALFKDNLKDNDANDPIVFMLLEKEDKPTEKNADTFVKLTAAQNVYQAYGSYIEDGLNRWSKETNQQITKLNGHVTYIHSKFLLSDPLSKNPIVITGSANFSDNSTTSNDENMIIIKGNQRVADIYFTEFNRLFNHYYFRAILNKSLEQNKADTSGSLFLSEDDSWLVKYKKGTLKYKRVKMFVGMAV
jgi:phosphatidylserine/phosphatidylglycerophosphate/cardiolipin synthase-like enzyme